MTMTKIEKLANSFNNDVEKINLELKRLASAKSRLIKQKGRPDYQSKMDEILRDYQELKEAKALLEPKKKTSMDLTADDIAIMTYDEVAKARNAIASHMTRTRWITEIEGDNDEFRQAQRVDDMLKAREKEVKPIEDTVVRKSDIQMIIDTIEAAGTLSNERILEMLKNLI